MFGLFQLCCSLMIVGVAIDVSNSGKQEQVEITHGQTFYDVRVDVLLDDWYQHGSITLLARSQEQI